MDGKLFRLKITQAEMFDLGNIGNIDHHVLYDSGAGVAVDITAEVNQAPLLSEVRPYRVVSDTSVLEDYLSGAKKPVENWNNAGCIPCITGFEAEELIGEQYKPVRQTMVRLRDAQKSLDDRVGEMREHCLATNLVKSQETRQY
jgi:hypothetical protein